MNGTTHAIRVRGDRALFTHPHLRADPYTQACCTPSAGGRMASYLYWKPELRWEVTFIEVLAPIQYWTYKAHAKKTWGPSSENNRTLQTVTILCNVDYLIGLRLQLNPHRVDVRTALPKYLGEATDRLKRGSYFRWPHLGTMDCPVSQWEYVDPRNPRDRASLPEPRPITEDLGTMLLDQIPVNPDKDLWEPVFFRARLNDGVLVVPKEAYEPTRERVMQSLARFPARTHRTTTRRSPCCSTHSSPVAR